MDNTVVNDKLQWVLQTYVIERFTLSILTSVNGSFC
jgi:hypothetical protein